MDASSQAVALDISATDRMIDLVSEGIDAVVRLAVLEDSDLICRRIGVVPIPTCGGAGYIARYGTPGTPADLTIIIWSIMRSGCPPFPPSGTGWRTDARSLLPCKAIPASTMPRAMSPGRCPGMG